MDLSDVFISYRRKNLEFARKLDTAFKNEGMEVWIDSEDIAPASPEYDRDIEKGIEGANVFIPVFSPDYFESEICKKELQLAADNKKRIIPVVFQKGFDAAISSMPDYVQKVNWVYFCPHLDKENDFDAAFPELLEGIKKNHDYARLHTQYLMRAKTWEDNQRNESYLLDDDAIIEAETWLATEVTTEPYPSPLQSQFIAASRQAENIRLETERKRIEREHELQHTAARRQRNFIYLFFGVLLIASAWLLYSSVQMQSAAETALQQYLETSLNIGSKYVIDAQTMQEVIESNGADAASLETHYEQLDILRALYPGIVSYTIDDQGNMVGIGVNPEKEDDDPQIAIPLDTIETMSRETVGANPGFYHLYDGNNRWIVGWIDIVDTQDAYLGQLVMEYRDPRSQVENSLLIALGFLFIFTVLSIIVYILLAMWHRIRNWFSKSGVNVSSEKVIPTS